MARITSAFYCVGVPQLSSGSFLAVSLMREHAPGKSKWREVSCGSGDGKGYVVREAPLKTRYSRRTLDISPSLAGALLALPASDRPGDFIFRSRTGGPIDPDNVDRAFKRHLALAGLPEIRFHDLRHTHASLLIAAGVHPKAIQARLGHASIATTLNTYGHVMPSAFEGVGLKVAQVLGPVANAELIVGT